MSNFYTLLTRVGAALHANAQVNQTTVPWTHMRLGDGNGAAVVPTENQTGLVRQVHMLQITDIAVHPDNPNWVIAEAVVPSDVGGWTVRETAIYGGADGNTCIAVGNYPETYKPVLAEGAGREMVMRMVVQISSVATVKLLIDPAVAIASRAWVESLKATPQKAGLVKLADIPQTLEGERGDVAVTPQGLQAALNARMDMIDARVAATEGAITKLPVGTTWVDKKAVRAFNTTYTNNKPYDLEVSIGIASITNGNFSCEILIDGLRHLVPNSYVPGSGSTIANGCEFTVPAGKTYSANSPSNCTLNVWREKEKA